MKERFLKSIQAFYGRAVLLQETTLITDSLKEVEPYLSLLAMYEKASGGASKAIPSLLNSIVTHNRVFFSMTRDALAHLVRNDTNHPHPTFSNETYAKVRAFMQSQMYVRQVFPGNRGLHSADSFEVIDTELLKYLSVEDSEYQRKEAELFSQKKFLRMDGKADDLSDGEIREERSSSERPERSVERAEIIVSPEIHEKNHFKCFTELFGPYQEQRRNKEQIQKLFEEILNSSMTKDERRNLHDRITIHVENIVDMSRVPLIHQLLQKL